MSSVRRHRTARTIRRVVPLAMGALAIAAAPALAMDPTVPLNECTTPNATGYAAHCYTDLMIAKTANKAIFAPGETVLWTITISNEGETTIPTSHVTVIDPTLTDLRLVSGPGDGWLRPKQTMTYQASTVVNDKMCGPLTRRTEVDLPKKFYGDDDRDVSNDRGDATLTIVCAPPAPPVVVNPPTPPTLPSPPAPPSTPAPLVVAPVVQAGASTCPPVVLGARVSASKGVVAGQVTSVTLTARNTSANAASSAVLTYSLPSGMSLVNRPAGSSLRRGVLTMRLGTLAPAARRAIAVKVRIDRSSSGLRTHRAAVRARCSAAIATTARTRITQVGPRVQPAVTG